MLGLCLLTAIGVAAMRSPDGAPSPARRALGTMLVVVPLPLALAFHLLMRPDVVIDQAAFALGAVAFGVGAFLLLPWNGEDERRDGTLDLDPRPWWPAFERQFRAYERRVRA